MGRIHELLKNIKEYIIKGGNVLVRKATPIAFDGKPLDGKIVLISGGTSGIGFNLAEVLQNAGAKIIVTGRNEERVKKVVESLPGVKGLCWDISDNSKTPDMMKKAFSIFGDVDILVNNAGIYDGTLVGDMTEETFDRVMDTNFKGTYFMSQSFLSNIKEDGENYKKIINVLSIRAFTTSTNMYCASKWAGKCFTEGLAKEMIEQNRKVIVNAVAPGPTCSQINNIMPEGNTFYPGGKRVKYFLLPEEVTNVIAFLCMDMSNGIVGQTIVVDGGEIIR